jgi:hypothetical protein
MMDIECDEDVKILKECGALLSKLSEMFVEEISLKSWFMKARDSEERQNLTRRDIEFAVMRTEEYDFLVELFDEEQQNKAKSLDPNRLDLGYWRASKILDSSIVGAKENVSIEDLNIFPNEDDVANSVINLHLLKEFDAATKSISIAVYGDILISNFQLKITKGFTSASTAQHTRKLSFVFDVTSDKSIVSGGVGVVEISIADKETMSMNLIFNRVDGRKIRYQINCVPSYMPIMDEDPNNSTITNRGTLGPATSITNGPELFVYDENELPKLYERQGQSEVKSDTENNDSGSESEKSGPEFYEPSDDDESEQ